MKEPIKVKLPNITIDNYFLLKEEIESDYKYKIGLIEELGFEGKARLDIIIGIKTIYKSNLNNLQKMFERTKTD
tara:strand:+ start:261 stop:482 length:222 start_codon:yes stop_codon:yes gene_type:complete